MNGSANRDRVSRPHGRARFFGFVGLCGTVPDMAVLRSLVANGYGYSIANVRPLNARSPDGKPLHSVPIIGDVRPMKMGILTTPEAENVNVIRAFVQHCKVECTRDALIGLHTIAD